MVSGVSESKKTYSQNCITIGWPGCSRSLDLLWLNNGLVGAKKMRLLFLVSSYDFRGGYIQERYAQRCTIIEWADLLAKGQFTCYGWPLVSRNCKRSHCNYGFCFVERLTHFHKNEIRHHTLWFSGKQVQQIFYDNRLLELYGASWPVIWYYIFYRV